MLTSAINLATSLLAGLVIFAGLGYIAHTRSIGVDQLGLEGPSSLIHFNITIIRNQMNE